jgi:dynein heavy chain
MSPAGDNLRIRCRNFPGIVNNSGINWFFSWPDEALVSVAQNQLEEVELPPENREAIVSHIVLVHTSV